MKLRPVKKALFYQIFSCLFISIFSGFIPALLYIFILAMLSKLGRQNTIQDNQTLLIVYIFSFLVIYLIFIVKKYIYIKTSYISFDKHGIEVYQSFISQTKKIVPYINVQSFEVNQSVFERLIGLGTIFLYTKNEDENYELSGYNFKMAEEFVENAVNEYHIVTK